MHILSIRGVRIEQIIVIGLCDGIPRCFGPPILFHVIQRLTCKPHLPLYGDDLLFGITKHKIVDPGNKSLRISETH